MSTTTERPDWQIFEDKTLSLVLLASIPVIAVLLFIVFCVLIYCCCKYSKQVETAEYTPEDLIKNGVQPEALRAANITPKMLRDAGATYKQMAQLGATPSQLADCGATEKDLEELGATPSAIEHVEKKNKDKYRYRDKNESTVGVKNTSSHKDLVKDMTKYFTASKVKKQDSFKSMTEKSNISNAEFIEKDREYEKTESPDDDTKSTVTTATAIRPVKSDTFSTAMLAHGSEISTAPQPKQGKDSKRRSKSKPWTQLNRFN